MEVKRLVVGPLDTNCYIAASDGSCAVVDPGEDAPIILKEIVDARLSVSAILLTHGHFDHFTAAGEIRRATGAPVYIGAEDMQWLKDPDWMEEYMPEGFSPLDDVRPLRQGDKIAVGSETLTVIHTPGHSPGSVCFRVPGALFAGDLLFRRSVGRTDLPGGDATELRNSLRKVMELPGETRVYPGHGLVTNIADEKRANPFLA